MAIPAYIEERIRRAPPERCFIVPQSTPVVAFGDATKARVATLGINPSNQEFYDSSGRLLEGNFRRLSTYKSLGIDDISNSPRHVIQQVLEDCNNYFKSGADFFWFKALNRYLAACKASYGAGSACHLDLVQWATSLKWNTLENKHRNVAKYLVNADKNFLKQQIQCESIEILLINGAKVWDSILHMLPNDIKFVEHDAIIVADRQKWRFYSGSIFNKTKIIGWSANRQGSFIANRPAFDDEICRRIDNIIAGRPVV